MSDSDVLRLDSDDLFGNQGSWVRRAQGNSLIQSMFGDAKLALEQLDGGASNDSQSKSRRLEIDFAGVDSISSANLGELIRVHHEACEMDVSMVLVNVGQSVRDIFSLTRLDRIFTLVDSEATIP